MKKAISVLMIAACMLCMATACEKKDKKENDTSAAQATETVGESIGDQTADTEKMTESETEKKKETKTTDSHTEENKRKS